MEIFNASVLSKKKGMFDKPNTAGFIHVFHHLSIVYDAKLFKQMVRWPILCKKDEVIYRTEVKNFLSVLSRDNPDANFPTILMSHLILSGGTKFLIIMWKVSQLALRAYIKRQSQEELLSAPCTSLIDDLTIAYFNNITARRCSAVRESHGKTKRILDITNNFIKNEIETLSMYKMEIFERKENIKRLVSDMSIHPLAKEQLTNIEDLNIINMWKRNITEGLQYVRKKNKELNEVGESCSRLCKLILRINPNSEILDAIKFPKISSDNYLLYTQSEIQHLTHDLYANGFIVFSTLVSLLSLVSVQMMHHINTANSTYLSQYLLCIQQAYEHIKSLQMLFVALETRITNILMDEQHVSREIKNVHTSFNADEILIANRGLFLQSPKINFNFEQFTDNNLFHEEMYSSPIEEKHKHLFKRYKHKYCPLYEMPMTLSDFSDSSWNNLNIQLSSCGHSSRCEQVRSYRKPISSLYSRLLHSPKSKPKRSRENILCSPSLVYETPRPIKRRRSTPRRLTTNNYAEGTKNLSNPDTSSSLYISSDIEN